MTIWIMKKLLPILILFTIIQCKKSDEPVIIAPQKLTDTWWNCNYVEGGDCWSKRFICNTDGTYQNADVHGNRSGNWYWIVTDSIFEIHITQGEDTGYYDREIIRSIGNELVLNQQNYTQKYHYIK